MHGTAAHSKCWHKGSKSIGLSWENSSAVWTCEGGGTCLMENLGICQVCADCATNTQGLEDRKDMRNHVPEKYLLYVGYAREWLGQ